MKANDIDALHRKDGLSVVPYFLGRDGARPSSFTRNGKITDEQIERLALITCHPERKRGISPVVVEHTS